MNPAITTDSNGNIRIRRTWSSEVVEKIITPEELQALLLYLRQKEHMPIQSYIKGRMDFVSFSEFIRRIIAGPSVSDVDSMASIQLRCIWVEEGKWTEDQLRAFLEDLFKA